MNLSNAQSPRLSLGLAIKALERGLRVSRTGWNGKGQFLELQKPDDNSKMTLPYIYITTAQGDRVPWLASQTDLLAEDWYVLIEREVQTLTEEHKDRVWKLRNPLYPSNRVRRWLYSQRGWLTTLDGKNWSLMSTNPTSVDGFIEDTCPF